MRVLFSFAGGTGHFYPLLPIARAARAAGHDVAFVGTAAMAAELEAAGFPALAAEAFPASTQEGDALRAEIEALPTVAEREALTLRRGFAGYGARRKAPHVLAVCEQWPPDLIVRDEFDFGACVAAELLGLPHATVLVNASGSFVQDDLIAEPLNALRAIHDLPPDPDLAMLSRYLVVCPFPPRIRDPRSPLPATGHVLRHTPVDRPGDELLPAWVAHLPDRPTLYFSLGTAWNVRMRHLFLPVIAALAGEPLNLVVTVGRNVDPADLGPLPANMHVERYIPLSALVPRCDAVISHGGSGTIMTALSGGVPLVLLPLGADQPQNAARCAALGVARVLNPDDLSPATVRQAVAAVLNDPSFRQNAQHLQEEIADLPGPPFAVALLERLAATRMPQEGAAGS